MVARLATERPTGGPHPGRHAQGSDERRLGLKVQMWHCLAQSSCRFGVLAIAATVADGLTAGRMRSGPQTRVVSVKPALGLVGHRTFTGDSRATPSDAEIS